MPAIAFSDFDALPDVLQTSRFEFLISPPSGSGDNRTFALRCQQIAIPGTSIEQMIVAIHGYEYVYRGRKIYPKTCSASFTEHSDGATTKSIRKYFENIVGSESGGGLSKKEYALQATLNVFDEGNRPALVFTLENFWMQDLQDIQLDGTSSTAMLASAVFSYDRILQDGVPIT